MSDEWCDWLRLSVNRDLSLWTEVYAVDSPEPWCDDYRIREMVGGRVYEHWEEEGALP